MVFPSADEWKRRLSERQARDGEPIPETALLKLQRLLTFESLTFHLCGQRWQSPKYSRNSGLVSFQ